VIGMGGGAVAKYLRLWGDSVGVTLVERRRVKLGEKVAPRITAGAWMLRFPA
jgi:hypothetical protein